MHSNGSDQERPDMVPTKREGDGDGFQPDVAKHRGIVTAATLPTLAIIMGWRYGYVVVGTFSIGIAVIAYTFYRDPPNPSRVVEAPQRRGSQTRRNAMSRIILNGNILLASVSGLGLAIVEFSLTTYLIIYLKEAVGLSVVLGGGYLALTNGGGAFGKPVIGFVSDRLFGGSRKKPLLLVIAIIVVFSVVMQFLTSGTSYWLLIAVFTMFGFAALGWGGLTNTFVSEFADRELTGLTIGYSQMILLAGTIVGPPTFGYIVDVTGYYSLGWWFLTACALLSGVSLIFVREEERKTR